MTPLETSHRDALVAVATRARLLPLDHPRFPAAVAEMTRKYNDPSLASLRSSPDAELAARLGFWFPRDVPKVQCAVRDVVIEVPKDRALRVLDLGAGLGASHRGLLRALAAQTGRVEVLAVDDDPRALTLLSDLCKALGGEGGLSVETRTEVSTVEAFVPRARPVDVVLLGQVLGELDRAMAAEERRARHAAMLDALVAKATWVVVVEPALRVRARHLQELRPLLAAKGRHIHAPCLHDGECPLLVKETDWCHEDRAVDLPTWLAPVARAAGLRWEGLTFSHLVLSSSAREDRGPRLRAVSDPLVSKGKRELLVCGTPIAAGAAHGARLGRLDRARSEANQTFDDLSRGSVFSLEPFEVDDKRRIGSATRVTRR